jgi:FKBP-type peptidyl-prolyl cis-trans isomerase SlyD
VEKPQKFSLHCILRNRMGQILSSSFTALITYPDGRGGLPREFSRQLQEMKIGERRQVHLSADEAYGYYDDELVFEVPRTEIPGLVDAGVNVVAETDEGRHRVFRVIRVSRTHVTLDGNHPLAGQDLVFDLEAREIREATDEELAQDVEPGKDSLLSQVEPKEPRPGYLH